MPGGDGSVRSRARPVDLAHLARQTMGDRDLEQEVLPLFVQQALSVRDRIAHAGPGNGCYWRMAEGSARGIGAFAIAECAGEIEKQPDDRQPSSASPSLIDEVRDFIAAISR